MRRLSLAVLMLVLAAGVAPQLLAQSQDPLIASARQFAQQGNHDTAINMLRGALASRPADAALTRALLDVLELKQQALSQQLTELRREIAEMRGEAIVLRPSPFRPSTPLPGCGPAPVRVGGNIRTPIRVKNVDPVYPPLAQQGRVQGLIIIEAIIDCQGNIADARVLRGQPLLNEAALESVRQWQYTPTLLNGVPVPVIMTVTVRFGLE